jgi:general secretion pathway protein E
MPVLPYGFARRYGVLVADGPAPEGTGVRVLCRPDAAAGALIELRRHLGRPIRLETVAPEEFEERLAALYQQGAGGGLEEMEAYGESLDLQAVAQSLPEPADLLESEDDAPIIRLLNALLTEAVRENASDIHIEPFENRLVVRFRVDGVLREVLSPPPALAPLVASRVKVMARLDIAEKRLPQDGRISLRIGGRPVDVRVSTIPSSRGERVVLRLLDKQAGRLDLLHLGMAPGTLEAMNRLIGLPHGILTVEDPIEYDLDGIGQTQVNPKVEMTFARGLRAILRQDPDVVMVGEIRDLETAGIAVQASLTGHLVFSTLHTNTAVGAVTRLRDMGVEPFLLASSLVGVLAQRLVRLLCPECRTPYAAGRAECERMGLDPARPPTLFAPGGCPGCRGSGYLGRTGIYELVEVDAALRTLIHDGAGEHRLEAHARSCGPAIEADGWRRVLAGETSVEEVLRVSRSGP